MSRCKGALAWRQIQGILLRTERDGRSFYEGRCPDCGRSVEAKRTRERCGLPPVEVEEAPAVEPGKVRLSAAQYLRAKKTARKISGFARSVLVLCEKLEALENVIPDMSRSGGSAAGHVGSAANLLRPDAEALETASAVLATSGGDAEAAWRAARRIAWRLPEKHPLREEVERLVDALDALAPRAERPGPTSSPRP